MILMSNSRRIIKIFSSGSLCVPLINGNWCNNKHFMNHIDFFLQKNVKNLNNLVSFCCQLLLYCNLLSIRSIECIFIDDTVALSVVTYYNILFDQCLQETHHEVTSLSCNCARHRDVTEVANHSRFMWKFTNNRNIFAYVRPFLS